MDAVQLLHCDYDEFEDLPRGARGGRFCAGYDAQAGKIPQPEAWRLLACPEIRFARAR
ncbi:hypothetical protein F751_2858 [Auxenochlorella protothecoides]|uniref:Uncharacterized protein n=1 Tax=Auxenochlorella protothecoides TaxID=3075 RepID=A0A087SCZ5_AUXPR|nr:hypothetical protein F751_2858 [Auxenochlorella protothecoides]KFM23599.1 hypothetical protein F751_2858 [Auxenochlorella protothecoides]